MPILPSATRRLVAAVLMLLVAATQARAAGPLPERWVAPQSDWVVHVDAERLSQAEALRPVFDALAASTWGASLTDMGIDARMDLTGITMFGTMTRGPEAKGETTTILQGGAALREAIQAHVQSHQGYTLVLRSSFKADGQGICAWTIDSLSVHVALVPMAGPEGGEGSSEQLIAILSDNSNRLQAAIGQLLAERRGEARPGPGGQDGQQSPLDADGRSLGPFAPPEGSVIFAYAKDLHEAHPPPKSALLASAESLTGHLGYQEQGEQLIVFTGLQIHGCDGADIQAMEGSLKRMVEFWANRTAELAQRNPALIHMLPLLQDCLVSSTGQQVSLSMKRALPQAEEPAIETVRTAGATGSSDGDAPSHDR